MKIEISYQTQDFENAWAQIVAAYKKEEGITTAWSDKELQKFFLTTKASQSFKANKNQICQVTTPQGNTLIVVGLGEKKSAKEEEIRRAVAHAYKAVAGEKYESVALDLASFNAVSSLEKTLAATAESLLMSQYAFNKYKSTAPKNLFKSFTLYANDKKLSRKLTSALTLSTNLANSVNTARDLINEVPNVLDSVEYAKRIEKEVKTDLKGKGVKLKVLGKEELKKEKMNLFLAVNAASSRPPRMVQLTYTPKKLTKNTKHIVLVGKGLTFDTGGYSLKPGASMMGMKFDMGGSATVYGAFKAAALNASPYKITCILGITDNAIGPTAVTPDSVVKARNGKTVEILNTDAEGRLVLADCLSYASDLKPDLIIDAATLTGACLVALGTQVCALFGNDHKQTQALLKSAKARAEYLWEMPLIDEWREDMKSKIADLKNIGGSRFAGTATAAAFLEEFVAEGISWIHLDIAGVASDASHLPYCPAKGGSGSMVRSLYDFLMHG